jgi:folate-binding protein YgfZ
MDRNAYNHIRSGGAGFIEMPRGLVAVSGQEAVQFLDGMITNDMKTLEDGQQMLAAFPNAQGRLLGVIRVIRIADRYLIETEDVTRENIFQNLFRFTFAGDFFVEDLSEQFQYVEIFGPQNDVYNPNVAEKFEGAYAFLLPHGSGYFVSTDLVDDFRTFLTDENGCVKVDDELYETLRVESGTPKFGVDMDETTIVPELGLDGMISYTKGCYIGQEIIARIHFRGHVAKQLTGLVSEPGAVATGFLPGAELKSTDGKNAGKITSVTFSPQLQKQIALAYVRYDYLVAGTALLSEDAEVTVTSLPFI